MVAIFRRFLVTIGNLTCRELRKVILACQLRLIPWFSNFFCDRFDGKVGILIGGRFVRDAAG
jgi:hypothetical protein